MTSSTKPFEPIAIVGLSALFPGATDVRSFWSNILERKDCITDVPATHWLIEDYYDPDPSAPDKTYAKRGGFISPLEFDTLEFGILPNAVAATDTAQLLALIVARKVLDDACRSEFTKIDRDRVSVILGSGGGTELMGDMVSRLQRPVWQRALRETGMPETQVQEACDRIANQFVPWQESTFPGLLGNVVAGRIANRLGLGGANCVVDAACASSLAAISMAVNELQLEQSDMAIVGGVDALNDIEMFMCFSKTPALSMSGDVRPFSSKADGTMIGEGIGMLALRRLTDAERDGDAIYAVLRGVGFSSDGRSKSVYAPVPAGQAKALRRAYEAAGYGPETVELVEAHGTGTVAGDAAEFRGLLSVFQGTRDEHQWCALGTVKSQIGHTKAAAGAAGMIKAALALHHRVLPPTIKVDEPNPELDIANTPFYLNTISRPWIANEAYPRRASVSSFGFGGSNFHIALEEYQGPGRAPKRLRSLVSDLLLISGADAAAVATRARSLAAQCDSPMTLAYLAHESRAAFDSSQRARLGIVATDLADARAKLDRAAGRLEKDSPLAAINEPGLYYQHGEPQRDVAFLFPGQGSQYVGMGSELAIEFGFVRDVWDRAARVIDTDGASERFADVVFPKPVFTDAERELQDKRLTSTDWAQPAIGAASLGYLEILRALDVSPMAVGGHSFGEVTALHAAGSLSERDCILISRDRGRAMGAASATSPGTMTAVQATAEEVAALLDQSGTEVVLANLNEPRQTVVSGSVADIAEFESMLERKDVKFRRVRVSTAFHSPLMEPASRDFREFLGGVPFAPGSLPLFSNFDAAPYPLHDADRTRDQLAWQFSRPVRFVDQIRAMHDAGARVFIEVGPGTILTNMVQKTLDGRPHQAINLDRRGMHGVTGLFHGLARLATCGVPLAFDRLFAEFDAPVAPAKPRPAGSTVQISGINYGKPYPGKQAVPSAEIKPQILPPSPAVPAPAPAPVSAPAVSYATVPATPPIASNASPSVMSTPNDTRPTLADPSLIAAFAEFHRSTAETHLEFQRAMIDSHNAYLATMESFFAGLSGGVARTPALPAPPRVAMPAPVAPPAAVYAAPSPIAPSPVPAAVAPQAVVTQPTPTPAPAVAPAPVTAPTAAAPAAVPSNAPSTEDLKARLLNVVAEKTGYPLEILDLTLDMEADLGIDSIKRVEILAAFSEGVSGMDVQGKDMAKFRTLGDIVEFIESVVGERRLLQPSAAGA